MDAKEIAETIESAIGLHLDKNGNKTQRTQWLRVVVEVVIFAVIVTGGYFTLRADVDTNSADIRVECERSKNVDAKMADGVGELKLKLNTVEVKQDAVMVKQQILSDDLKEVDNKVGEVLTRLPK
tara:strand:- start:535 stop:909 length:375 start_codon:yes stop_codon:yes gene_type:complete